MILAFAFLMLVTNRPYFLLAIVAIGPFGNCPLFITFQLWWQMSLISSGIWESSHPKVRRMSHRVEIYKPYKNIHISNRSVRLTEKRTRAPSYKPAGRSCRWVLDAPGARTRDYAVELFPRSIWGSGRAGPTKFIKSENGECRLRKTKKIVCYVGRVDFHRSIPDLF